MKSSLEETVNRWIWLIDIRPTREAPPEGRQQTPTVGQLFMPTFGKAVLTIRAFRGLALLSMVVIPIYDKIRSR